MTFIHRIITGLLFVVLAASSACQPGGGATGARSTNVAGSLPAGIGGEAPSGGSIVTGPLGAAGAAASAGGGDTMPPRSDATDGMGDGDVEIVGFRVFLSPRPDNTQETSEKVPETVEAKDILNLKLLVQAGIKATDPETDDWSAIGWMDYIVGPYLRIVKTPKLSLSSLSAVLYQDQMGSYVNLGDKGYNGVIKDLAVTEGDVVSVYVFHQEDPKGISAETFFVKPPHYSDTMKAFEESEFASFAADTHTHLVAQFTIQAPSAPATEKVIPSVIPVTRPDGLYRTFEMVK